MAEYILTDAAKADIRAIYQYGLNTFGQLQVDVYVDGLFDQFNTLAEFPGLGLRVDLPEQNYRQFGYGAHVIIYETVESATLRIEMVVSARMDWLRILSPR